MSIFDPKHEHEVNDLDGYFIIDPITRSITNTTEAKTALMQYDHNSEIFSFAIPRYVEDHDMTICDAVQIHYINSSDTEKQPGLYMVTDIGINDSGEEEMVVFSWIISQQAIALKGSLQFQIKFICYDSEGSGTPSYIWSTKVFSAINVLPGLNNAEVVVTEYPDILSQLSSELSRINDKLNNLPGGGSGDVDLSDYYTIEVVDILLAKKANKGDVDDEIGRINEWLEGHEERFNSHQEQIESKLDLSEFGDFQNILDEKLNDMEEDIADLREAGGSGGSSDTLELPIPTKRITSVKDKINDTSDIYRLIMRDAIPGKPLKNYRVYGMGMGNLISDGEYKIDIAVRGRNIFNKNSYMSLQAVFSKAAPTLTAHSNVNVKTLCIPCRSNTIYTLSKQNSIENGSAIWIGYASTSETPAIGDSITFISGMDNSVKSYTLTTGEDATHIVVYLANMGQPTIIETLINTLQIEEWDYTEYREYSKEKYSCYISKPLSEGSYIDYETQCVYYSDGSTENATLPTILLSDPEHTFIETQNGYVEAEYYIKERNYFTDKTIVCFGDSITGNYMYPNDYPSILAELTTANVINAGFGGTTMSEHTAAAYKTFSMCNIAVDIANDTISYADYASDLATITSLYKYEHFNNLANVDFNNVDYVIIAFGANDIVAIGADVTTYTNAARNVATSLLTSYPHLKIVFTTPIYRYFDSSGKDSDVWSSNAVNYTGWGEALMELGKELHVPVIDMYSSLGINSYNRSYYFPEGNGTHPNEKGTRLMAENIAKNIK